jgi:dipeptide/tripeptide permease
VALLVALPALFGIWLGLSIAGTVLVGLGYGFFAPWIASFEAFRHDDDDDDDDEFKTLYHCVVVSC